MPRRFPILLKGNPTLLSRVRQGNPGFEEFKNGIVDRFKVIVRVGFRGQFLGWGEEREENGWGLRRGERARGDRKSLPNNWGGFGVF